MVALKEIESPAHYEADANLSHRPFRIAKFAAAWMVQRRRASAQRLPLFERVTLEICQLFSWHFSMWSSIFGVVLKFE